MTVPVLDLTPATRTSRLKRRSSSTCTRGFTGTSRSAPGTGSCPLTPSRRSMPAAACIPPCLRRPAGPSATSTNTSVAAPLRCCPAWTCTPGRYSPPRRSPPGSSRSRTSPGRSWPARSTRTRPGSSPSLDNGSDHRGQAAIDRLARAHPNAIMIHTPVHASWLNQIEIFFSVIKKKVVTPNDFASLEELSATLLAFTGRYNPDRPAVQLEIHRSRPARPHGPHQPPRAASPSGRTATGGRPTPPTN